MRGVLRALLRQLASRVSVQPTDAPPVRWALLAPGERCLVSVQAGLWEATKAPQIVVLMAHVHADRS